MVSFAISFFLSAREVNAMSITNAIARTYTPSPAITTGADIESVWFLM